MSLKLLWVGLTCVVALPVILPLLNLGTAVAVFTILGGLLMVVGAVLLVLDR